MKKLKKLQQLTLALVVMSFSFTSCNTDDPTPAGGQQQQQPTSYFTYQGETYLLDAGSVSSNVVGNLIVLHSSSVQLNAALDGFTGTGDGFSFFAYGANVVGTYTFQSDPTASAVNGEYNNAEININRDTADTSATGITITDGGTITITTGPNGEYIIDGSGNTSANNPYTIHYEGSLVVSNIL